MVNSGAAAAVPTTYCALLDRQSEKVAFLIVAGWLGGQLVARALPARKLFLLAVRHRKYNFCGLPSYSLSLVRMTSRRCFRSPGLFVLLRGDAGGERASEEHAAVARRAALKHETKWFVRPNCKGVGSRAGGLGRSSRVF